MVTIAGPHLPHASLTLPEQFSPPPAPQLLNFKAGKTEDGDDILTGQFLTGTGQLMCTVQVNTSESTTTFFDPSIKADLSNPNKILEGKKLATIDEDGDIAVAAGFVQKGREYEHVSDTGLLKRVNEQTIELPITADQPAIKFSVSQHEIAESSGLAGGGYGRPALDRLSYAPDHIEIQVSSDDDASSQAGMTQHAFAMNIHDGFSLAAGQEVSGFQVSSHSSTGLPGQGPGNTQHIEALPVSDQLAGKYPDRRIDFQSADRHNLSIEEAKKEAYEHKLGEWKDFSWFTPKWDWDPQTNGRLVFLDYSTTPSGDKLPSPTTLGAPK